MDNCNKSFHTQQSGFGEVELAARSCWDFFPAFAGDFRSG